MRKFDVGGQCVGIPTLWTFLKIGRGEKQYGKTDGKPEENHHRLRRLSEAQFDILHGDLLLFRRKGVISWAGRGEHSHAGMAAWWDDTLVCLEVREWVGGRIVTLESQVAANSGSIDVYRADSAGKWPQFNRHGCVKYMRQFAGCQYGYYGVMMTALTHLPFVRKLCLPVCDDEFDGNRPPFCSQACATAARLGGGVDPIPHLADSFCEPADLARSAFYEYQFTLEEK